MSQIPPESETAIAIKRRNWQQLLALGYVSREEYDLVGQHFGFVSRPERSMANRLAGAARTVGPVAGYVLLILGAVAEIVAQTRPELRGPLEGLIDLINLLGQQQ